jgi:hypothetical protein
MARPLPDGLRLPRHSTRYRRALNSHYWRDLRARLIAEREVCEVCRSAEVDGRPETVLQLHHLTYEPLREPVARRPRWISHSCITFRSTISDSRRRPRTRRSRGYEGRANVGRDVSLRALYAALRARGGLRA